MALLSLVAGCALEYEPHSILDWNHAVHSAYVYIYLSVEEVFGGPDICICYIASVQKSEFVDSAFASARLVALCRLAAGHALDYEREL